MRRSNLARRPRGNVEQKSFTLKGGLNLVDSPIDIEPGSCLAAVNYEQLTKNGYRRIDGIERFDGQSSPTDATYWILNYDAGVTDVSEGDVITGADSGHTADVLTNAVGSTTDGYIVITNATGIFQDNEDIEVSSSTVAVANGTANERGASTPALDATHKQDAIETQRSLILAVGSSDGSGPVRGLAVYRTVDYAFRDNTAGDACLMWKSTATGWVQQSLGNRVAFTLGTDAPLEGETLTQTGTTSTINRVVVQSGAFSTNDAAGYLVIGTVTSGPYASGAATSASGAMTLSGAEVANALAPGGRYEFEVDNFFGSSTTKRLYGVNGVSECFEWDGTIFTPILTGNTVDTPFHISVHEFHLILSFQNGSSQNSSTGNPYLWSGLGAAEIGVGHDILGYQSEVGSALVILCDDHVFMLYGKNTTASPWDLKTVNDESGGKEWTMQRMSGGTRFLDDQGFMNIKAVQEFGSFDSTTYSQVIEPLVTAKKEIAVSSIISRKKNQLRTFFSDGTAIFATFKDRALAGFTTVSYKRANGSIIPALVTADGKDANGSEILFFGSLDGFVYQMDKGTSIDGDPVIASLVLSYDHLGSPSLNKEYKKVMIEADGSVGTVVSYNAVFDYNSGRSPAGISLEETLNSGGSPWNDVFWNSFLWSTADVTLIEGDLDGIGRNIGLQLTSTSTYADPHTFFAITYHYIKRNLVR
jgi:hypothetical protein